MTNAQAAHRYGIWGFLACLSLVLFSVSAPPAQAEPAWTTYHRDAQRSGDDPDATQPIEPVLAWQTSDLGAPIWSQPLVLGDRVYVATVGDEAYALEASTGKVVWEKSLGTPVPAEDLPCGDVKPTVGVVGTPVIDPTKQTIYMVADTLNEKGEIEHLFKGLSLSSGEEVVSRDVDPPGADPKALLQRTALNLDEGNVVFGYGGNDGDCSDYQGAVVAAPEDGAQPRFWQYQPAPPSSAGGAVWAPAGPSVDEAGNVYATTGNPDPPAGEEATEFDYSDSVVKLNLADDFVADPATELTSPLGWFEPPNWKEESNHDLDLSSAAAELLPGGLLFQAGKDGVGYLIDEATMQSGAAAVFSHPVCQEHGGFSGSFGGDSFANGTLYIPCENGVQALAYSESAKTFTPLWQGPEDAVGPPIVSAGLVWTVATGGFTGGGNTLYGLDPTTGIPRYTETLPSPVIDHFASPSAAGGRLFLATGNSVSAYQIAQLAQGEPTAPAGNGPTSPDSPNPRATSLSTERFPVVLRRTHIHISAKGVVRVALRCIAPASSCRGTITLRATVFIATRKNKYLVRHALTIVLARKTFGPDRGSFVERLHVSPRSLARVRRYKRRISLALGISAPESGARQFIVVLS
jgi:polyvinyl alcohol dehydrogenase (cytochrome)